MSQDLLGQALQPIVVEAVKTEMKSFDVETQIKDLLGDVAKNAQKVITVKLEGEDKGRKLGLVHFQFEDLLALTAIKGMNVLLTGGAGLAKSTAVEQCAKAYDLPLGAISFSNQTTKTDLLGFVDANGIYRKSSFVSSFEEGKMFLADEMDACSANVLVLLNSAISNGFIETPDNKMINVHDNFRFVGTANTNLRGAKNGFSARNKLDAATIDRFAVIEWKLDEELESAIASNDGWVKIVRACRAVAEQQLEGVTITPRSSFDGAKLLKAGIEIDKVIRMVIIKAMGEDEEQTILSVITPKMKREAMGTPTPEPTPEPEEKEYEEKMGEADEKEKSWEETEPKPESDDDFEWE